jgi:hypothetical protein
MKKVIYSALFCALLSSCGGGEEEKKEPETFDEMKKAVCDCMEENKGDRSKMMECMEMQHNYSEKQKSEEERIRFIQETNECM